LYGEAVMKNVKEGPLKAVYTDLPMEGLNLGRIGQYYRVFEEESGENW